LTPFLRVELFTIHFRSLKPVVVPLMVQASPLEIRPIVDIQEDDEEGGLLLLSKGLGTKRGD